MSQNPPPPPPVPPDRAVPPPLPSALLNYRGGPGGIEGGAWRFKKTLFSYNQTILPERCVKCNSADRVKMKKKQYTWAPPMLYLLVLLNLLIAAIVIMLVQKKATVTYGLCGEHRRKQLNVLWISLGILGFAIFLIVLAIMLEKPVLLLGTLAGILASAIYGLIAYPVLRPQKIDKDGLAEFKGCGEEFLATLPDTRA